MEKLSGSETAKPKGKQKSTFGAAFSPRVHPRPEYPSPREIAKDAFISSVRQPILLALLTKALYPTYLRLVKSFKGKGYSEKFIFMIFAAGVHTGTYTIWNSFFLFCDHFKLLQQYKLHRKEYMQPSSQLLRKTFYEAFLGQVILGPIFAYQGQAVFKYFGMLDHNSKLQSFTNLVKFFAIAKLGNAFLFYWVHRICHHKSIYKYVHKQHHEYTGTIGIAAEYAHPVEQVFANQGPTILFSILLTKNPLMFYVWLWARLQETYEAHSGYCFANTFLHNIGLTNATHAAFHDFHHTNNKGNFGDYFLDAMFGTIDHWQAIGGEEGYIAMKSKKESKAATKS
mmetsp:Transcript_9514/g.11411  ORF Transcript_9514/g.11411 Transcript_9514/m.11411 type:complete len:340 (-) Transcript_9514:443-1462(-)